ncbi:MAG TPA: Allene oxide cyclase [Actinomycetota bacterium]|nr:Allene oxide cyclase [Actinomycetota bacterium]
MRKPLFIGMMVLVVIATALTISFAGTRAVTEPTRLHVVERAINDKYIDTGATGDSAGDLLTWYNPIYDATNTRKIGHDQGSCIRVSVRVGSWECSWLTFIAGHGAIMVEGAFFDGRDATLAITGGTLDYRNARGSMKLSARNNAGTAYNFVFMLLP